MNTSSPSRPVISYPDSLPITARREELLEVIGANQVVVVAGETGSGKSTQIPKMLLELGHGSAGLIGHTQPRRVAARSIAERIAEELGTALGDSVGYAVRFDDRVRNTTAVKVMTDGILLAELHRDPDLRRYDALVIDEAHERSLNVDFLLGYLKRLLPRRPDLKLVVTSATIDTDRFSDHFEGAPVVSVSGRTHPVEVRYRPYGQIRDTDEGDDVIDDDRDQVTAVCDAVDELGREGRGDVLVFLSGEREIRDTADVLAKRLDADAEILPLYARLSAAEQHRVFAAHGKRRIVLATNVAETSLTVPGVRYVVDAGTARISRYSHRLKVQRLPIEKISRASADQRAGRCGRVAPGICIRLYSEDDYAARPEFTDPEIRRTNLASVILRMLDLGLGDVEAFPFLDPPDGRSIRDGLALLEELGAIERGGVAGSDRRLTPVGRRLVRLPVDPRLGRMVLEADRLGCVRETVVIAAALSIQDPRERPEEHRAAADEAHRRFRVQGSDFLPLVALWDHLVERRRAVSGNRFRRECREQYLNHLRVREWFDLVDQLARAAKAVGIKGAAPGAGAHPDAVHRALLAGLLSHVGMREREIREFRGARNVRFQLVRDSALAKRPPEWVVAAELVETNRLWGRRAAAIDPAWAEELGEHLLKRSYGEARWDRRSARAVTDERVTLYGLPLVVGRKVGFDRADRAAARDLFIEHALVRREWDSRHAFLADNDAYRSALADTAERLRRVELLDDDTLFDFYDRRLPERIVSGRHFDSWWRKASRSDPDLLRLTAADLAELGVAHDPADFPDTWQQGDIELPVTYAFDPGGDLDGVTVHVPMAVLQRLEPWDFDWQVPGYRAELIEALVAGAPKAIRRELAPMAETARAVAAEVTFEDRPLVDVLAEVLSHRSGSKVRAADLDVTGLPSYLRITFAVHRDGEVVALGKDLAALRDLVGVQARAAVAAAHAQLERDHLVRWDFPALEETVRATAADGNEIVGHPALVDDGDPVSIRVFADADAAARVHATGLRRLLLLNVVVGVKGLAKSVPNDVRLALGAVDGLGLGGLLRDVIAASADSVISAARANGSVVRDADAFEDLVTLARRDLPSTATRALRDAGAVLLVASRVAARLDRLAAAGEGRAASAIAESVRDARDHLSRLVRPGFVASAGTGRLGDVERYVRGIERRLQRLPDSPGRDRAALVGVLDLEGRYRRLLGILTPAQMTAKVVETGWLLEELRVGVFAESVGVARPVSVKKLSRRIDALFAGDLD